MVSAIEDAERELFRSELQIYVRTYKVMKETPKGVWLWVYGRRRFVLHESRKKFAHPTLDSALTSFKARKAAQIRILSSQIARAEQAVTQASMHCNQLQTSHLSLTNAW